MWHDIAQDAVAEDYIAQDNIDQENVAQDKVAQEIIAQEIIAQDSVVQDKVYRDYIDQESLDLFHWVFLRDRSRVYAVAPKYETGAVPVNCNIKITSPGKKKFFQRTQTWQ